MREIEIYKMHGSGNDFVFIILPEKISCDIQSQSAYACGMLSPDDVKYICDRNYGVGCDQLIILNIHSCNFAIDQKLTHRQAYHRMLIYNPDGTQAIGICGNAAKCAALLAYNISGGTINEVIVGVGNREINVMMIGSLDDKQDVDDIIPKLLTANVEISGMRRDIPYTKITNEFIKRAVVSIIPGQCRALETWYDHKLCFWVDVGNEHIVFVKDGCVKDSCIKNGQVFRPIDRKLLQIASSDVRQFPNEINASMLHIKNRSHIHAMTHERKTGFTKSCSSGACAMYHVCYTLGLVNKFCIVSFDDENIYLMMSDDDKIHTYGEATMVCHGTVFL